MTEKYQPTFKSVRTHQVPEWFHDAKLGIFIHWGLFSVPAFAPSGKGKNLEILEKEGWTAYYGHNPYAEWYINTMKIDGSPTQNYHFNEYGKDFSYDDFIPIFNEAIKQWDPNEWVELFENVGARYVVLVTKHMDGFMLWPSNYLNPKRGGNIVSRDIVGELTKAVKENGLRMGLYYCSGLDLTFSDSAIIDVVDEFTNTPNTEEYIDLMASHWHELIDRYKPSIIWNDVGYPKNSNPADLIAYFYNEIAEGVVNDRWMQVSKFLGKFARTKIGRKIICWYVKRMFLTKGMVTPNPPHCDFSTPEYSSFSDIVDKKWEATRGLGTSFGFNKSEKPEDYLTVDELIRMFVDIVSKNGNLLLNLGPKADGTIPEVQKNCVLGLGKWLEKNGQAIFRTRPWVRAESITSNGIQVRFTQNEETLYVIILDSPTESSITIKSLQVAENSTIKWLGYNDEIEWLQKGENLTIMLPNAIEKSPAYAISITPKPSSQ